MPSQLSEEEHHRDDPTPPAGEQRGHPPLPRALTAAILRWLPLGGGAGALIALPDATQLLDSGAVSRGVEAAAFTIAGFSLLGGACGSLVGLAEVALGPVRNARNRWRAGLVALVALIALIVVSPRLFAGARISRTAVAGVGPWLLPPIGAVLVFVCARTLLGTMSWFRARRWRRGAIVIAALASACAFGFLHQLQVCRYYPAIGLGLSVAAWALVVHALAVAFPAQGTRFGRSRAAVTLTLATSALWLFGANTSNDIRVALARAPVGFNTFAALWLGAPGQLPEVPPEELERRFREIPPYGPPLTREETAAPHVVLVVIDALRADRWSPRRASDFPALARVRQECVAFSRAFAPGSSTEHSMSAILGGGTAAAASSHAELLWMFRRSGYRLGIVAPPVVFRLVEGRVPLSAVHDRTVIGPDEVQTAWGGGLARETGLEIADKALRWMRRHAGGGQPVMLWVHFFTAHQWMLLPTSGSQAERYDAALRDDDRGLDRLLEGLRDIGLSDDTIVVVASDHGESLGAHGWDTHSTWLYPELIHVPLAFCIPGMPSGQVDAPVGTVSIGTTLADLSGLEGQFPSEGASLLPLMSGDAPHGNRGATRPILLGSLQQSGVIYGERFVRYTASTRAIELLALEDALAGDETNLAAREPERTARLLGWIGISASR
jgi:hypothetical protein